MKTLPRLAVLAMLCSCARSPQSKKETWAAQLIYFNSNTHSIDTTYSDLTMIQDSVVDFKTASGKVWRSKDIIENNVIEDTQPSTYDITVSSGERFKIMPLDSGNVRPKSIMDSIKESYVTEN